MQVRRNAIAIAVVFAGIGGCGPVSVGESANANTDGGVASNSTGGQDGGSAAVPQTGSSGSQDGGADQPGGGARQQLVVVRDIHTNSVTADVLYAHDVHAKNVRYTRLTFLSDKQVPAAGRDDVHGDVLDAQEIHAHDVHVTSLDADTLYVHALHND
jgi:hypothetical protein